MDWKDEAWKPRSATKSPPTNSTVHEMAIQQRPADALEALMSHYSARIVYVVYCFWRKLLLRCWMLKTKQRGSKPPLTAIADGDPGMLGVAGALKSFTTFHLPMILLRKRIPLTVDTWSLHGAPLRHPSEVGGEFLMGLICAQQVDVVKCLVDDLGLDRTSLATETHLPPDERRVGGWTYAGYGLGPNLGGVGIIHMALRVSVNPPESTVAAYLLQRLCHLLKQTGERTQQAAFTHGENVSLLGRPLHCAAINGYTRVVILLLSEFGVDIDGRDGSGVSAIHEAARYGHADVVSTLLHHGADANAQDGSKWTPLHLAALNLHPKVCRVLVDAGANVFAEKSGVNRKTPLDLLEEDSEPTAREIEGILKSGLRVASLQK